MQQNISLKPFKLAIMVGLATFAGFSSVFLFMAVVDGVQNWQDFRHVLGTILILFGYFLFAGTSLIGLVEALMLGLVGYFIFKFLVPSSITKKQYRIIMILALVSCGIIGFISFQHADKFIRELHSGKEHVWEIDTNGDKRPDKWVHDDVYDRVIKIDYDTNFDGEADVWEYYENREVIKKELDDNFDGKLDKTENFR